MPYKPNFISIVPCGPVGTTPFTDSFRVIQLFGACPANFILLIIKGSNPIVQKRWPCLISIWGLYFITEKQMTTVRTLEEEEGGSRIFSHPKLKTWSLSLPRACPLATFCFAAFFAGALIKHDLCPRLPLARIYCITSKKNYWNFWHSHLPLFWQYYYNRTPNPKKLTIRIKGWVRIDGRLQEILAELNIFCDEVSWFCFLNRAVFGLYSWWVSGMM